MRSQALDPAHVNVHVRLLLRLRFFRLNFHTPHFQMHFHFHVKSGMNKYLYIERDFWIICFLQRYFEFQFHFRHPSFFINNFPFFIFYCACSCAVTVAVTVTLAVTFAFFNLVCICMFIWSGGAREVLALHPKNFGGVLCV